METSCDWICNPTIVWLDEFAVVKNSGQNKKPTGCPRFDPVFGSNNNPLFGPLIRIITQHSIFVGVTTVVWYWGARVETHRLKWSSLGVRDTTVWFVSSENVVFFPWYQRSIASPLFPRSSCHVSVLQNVFFTMMCVVHKSLGFWRHHNFWSFAFMITTSPWTMGVDTGP